MKESTTAERLRSIMSLRELRQVDVLKLAQPYCEKYSLKLGKNEISQYVSGKVEPRQDKLSILGMALNVSEVWLMGYDVPMNRDTISVKNDQDILNPSSMNFSLSEREKALIIAYRSLNDEGQKKINDYLLGRTNIKENRPFTEARELSDKDRRILVSYHSKPEMQSSVDKLLDISEEKIHYVKVAARNGGVKEVALTDEELERLKNLPDVDDL